MFTKDTFIKRRNDLRKLVSSGIVLILGNQESSMNYPANTFHFRQDSNFLYFFGLDAPDLAGIIDIDNNIDTIFGNDVDMEDIIWMGDQPLVKDRASQVGISNTETFGKLHDAVKKAIQSGRRVHFVPPYRSKNKIILESLLGIQTSVLKHYASIELIKAIIKLREIKDAGEIADIEATEETAWNMHVTAMKMAKEGIYEREIAGAMEGIALAGGGGISFPIILSVNGQTLHNHYHGNMLKNGRLMVADAGAESVAHYATDITRTIPVSGKFDTRQREIYEIVLKANEESILMSAPNISYKSVHLNAARIVADGLKQIGLMKGNIEQAVEQGAHALFFPHGLGHMMGLDVHDMEDLGENFVGYDEEFHRSAQFGLAFLRLAKKLKPGFVLTVEPGIYFIPALIDQWKAEKQFTEFINYDKLEPYKTFGGIRIEDDILITESGARVLGKKVPKSVAEIENVMK